MSEAFLSRWSRMKKTGGDAVVAEPQPSAAPHVALGEAEKAVIPAAQNEPVLENISQNLPSVESLTNDSDFTAFMQPKVPEALKRQALKKLFANPQFNVMDGLDVYVDDYSISVPIPEDWYKDIPSWQAMLNPKPPMVVTDGGYAVEADSEEGIATLKAREEIASNESTSADASLVQPRSPQPLAAGGRDSELPSGIEGEGVLISAEPRTSDASAPLDQNQLPELNSQKNK